MTGSSTYGGFRRVIAQMEERRAPMTYGPGEALPPAGLDLAPLKTRLVTPVQEPFRSSRSGFAHKLREMATEFEGLPELLALHGLLIANLRRRDQPPQAAPLFLRMWREEADFLLENLEARWLVSAVATFAEHGETEVQRRIGQSLNVLFSTVKLYETERLHSGAEPWEPFAEIRKRPRRLTLMLSAYSIQSGGLDVNMLGRLWQDAAGDPVIGPLARHLLTRLDADERNIFRRLKRMRAARRESEARDARKLFEIKPVRDPRHAARTEHLPPCHDPHMLRWGVVATVIRATPAEVARFAAYHLDQGAARIDLYLDTADAELARILASDGRITVVQCDDAYWRAEGLTRPASQRDRRTHNANRCYAASEMDFLATLDVDEFLMPPQPLAWVLAHLPDGIAALQVPPAELLAGSERHFKLTEREAGHGKYAVTDIYPTFGEHLKGGFLGNVSGKPILRTGLTDVTLGLHRATVNGRSLQNRATLLGGWVGHAHVRSWSHFRARLEDRLEDGAYRRRPDAFDIHDMLRFLMENEGEAGLHQLYEEVCADTSGLRERLAQYGMLLTRDLALDDHCRRIFGRVPEEDPAPGAGPVPASGPGALAGTTGEPQ